jgi:dephospho-CoA kinase
VLVVGVTGGIGSGKTAVSDAFARRGIPVIDTDLLARELVASGQPALREIVEAFGPDVLQTDGQLDRAALRQRVFADPAAREQLEAILHPRIQSLAAERLARCKADYAVVVVPLLIETGGYPFIDRTLVIEADEHTRIARVQARSGLDADAVRAIMDHQASDAARRAVADDMIANSGTLADLDRQVERLHRRYREIAASQATGGG